MEHVITKLIEYLVLPPGLIIGAALFGLLVSIYNKRIGFAFVGLSGAMFYALCTPLVASVLMAFVETHPPLPRDDLKEKRADAIVVLAGGRYHHAPEYGRDTVSKHTLERLRYAALVYRQTKLPVIVSGGSPGSGSEREELRAEAALMKESLTQDFNVPVSITETQSKTTYENAKYTAAILQQNHYRTVFLVTHANHMVRAVEAFKHFGVNVIPASTAYYYTAGQHYILGDIVPRAYALRLTYLAMHELIGRWWYRLRYY